MVKIAGAKFPQGEYKGLAERMPDHPLTARLLGALRNRETNVEDFRRSADTLTRMLFYEALAAHPTTRGAVVTPVDDSVVELDWMSDSRVVLVPIMRAGQAMVAGALSFFPHASIGPIDISRNETTLKPFVRSCKLPKRFEPDDIVYVLDPMLATGGSLAETLRLVKERGGKRVTALTMFSVPEGLLALYKQHPDVRVCTAAVDQRLNDKGYIVPGIGDFGDRFFNLVV